MVLFLIQAIFTMSTITTEERMHRYAVLVKAQGLCRKEETDTTEACFLFHPRPHPYDYSQGENCCGHNPPPIPLHFHTSRTIPLG